MRLTLEKPVKDMSSWELAHNCMFVKDREAWYRDFDCTMPLHRLIREIAEGNNIALPTDNEEFDELLYCWLGYDPADTTEGMLALLNMLAWSHAENYEALKKYENAGEDGLIAACHCENCAYKEWHGNSGRVYCQKTNSWRDADDFCKFAESSYLKGARDE